MNQKEFLEYHKNFCQAMINMVAAKNHDYASGDGGVDAFNNLSSCERIGACTTEQGFIARIMDKIMRIVSLTRSDVTKAVDEKIEDTIMDACNYLILLSGYLKSKRK